MGNNDYGQLGQNPDKIESSTPVKVPFPLSDDGTERHIAIVAAGSQSTLAGSPGGTIFTMGEEGTGLELDSPTKKPQLLDLKLHGFRIQRIIDMGIGT